MGYNFPSSPTPGQSANGYTWDGEKWLLVGVGIPVPLDSMAYSGMQVNGGFEVNQKLIHGGVTALSGESLADCWRIFSNGTMQFGAGTLPSSLAPGLTRILYSTISVAQPSLGANDFLTVIHSIEGWRMARLGWGTANAKPITICFWSSHNRPGVYSVTFRNNDANRCYGATYNHVTPNVSQFNVITIPGDTSGVWPTTNGVGIAINFAIASGTTYTSPVVGTWLAGNYVASLGQVNAAAATSDVFRISGVVVLPGIYAPTAAQAPLLARPYDQELATCKRYWEKSYVEGNRPGAAVSDGANGILIGSQTTAPYVLGVIPYKVEKRASPTLVLYSGNGTPGAYSFFNGSIWTGAVGGSVLGYSSTTNFLGYNLPAGYTLYGFDYTADARL